MLINHDHLRAVVRAITTAGGSTGDEPNGVANNLVNANLTGHDSHGVGMLPRYIEAVEEVAKTATGKIQKEPLRQAGITNRTWDRESVGYKIPRRV